MTRHRGGFEGGTPEGDAAPTELAMLAPIARACRAWAEEQRVPEAPDALWTLGVRVATRLALLSLAEREGLALPGGLDELARTGEWSDLARRLAACDPGGFGPIDACWPMPADPLRGLARDVSDLARGATFRWPGRWYAASLGQTLAAGRAGLGLAPATRRGGLGVHHTPSGAAQGLAHRVLEVALADGRADPTGPGSLRVVDPAAGGGSLLLAWLAAATTRILERGGIDPTGERARDVLAQVAAQLHGVEIDPFAAAIARATVWLGAKGHIDPTVLARNIVAGCALSGADRGGRVGGPAPDAVDWTSRFGAAAFDVVIANPPFLDNKRIAPALKRAIADSGYRCARGLYDLAVPFVERCVDLVGPGGTIGVLIPNKLATRDYGEPLRRELATSCTLVEISEVGATEGIASDRALGEASVHPLQLVARRDPPSAGGRVRLGGSIGATFVVQEALAGMPRAIWPHADGVETVERVLQRAARGEARYLGCDLGRCRYRPCGFGWRAHVGAVADGDVGRALRFVGCASVTPFRIDWEAPFRLGGRRYQRSWLARPDGVGDEAWADLHRPKLLVREVATALTAAVDATGQYAYLTGLYGYVDLDPELPIEYVAGLLNSAAVRAFYAALFWNGHLSGGYLDVKGSYLALVPILPSTRADCAAIVECAERLARADDVSARRTLDRCVNALYGVDPV